MSMYYSPKLVKLLTDERLREAAEARLANCQKSDSRAIARPSRFAGSIDRIFARVTTRPSATPAACTC